MTSLIHRIADTAKGLLGLRGGASVEARALAASEAVPEISRPGRRRKQGGYSLLELTIVGGIVVVITVLGSRLIAEQSFQKLGEAAGVYLDNVRAATDAYLQAQWNALENNTPPVWTSANPPPPPFANPLQPTVAELRAWEYLPPGFPLFTPFNSTLQINLVRNNCPGVACTITAVGHQIAPVLDSAGQPRYIVADIVRQGVRGGLASDVFNQATLRGPAGDAPNPLGAQGGVIGFTTNLNTAMFNQFVRRNDTRLTELNNQLMVVAGVGAGGIGLQVGDPNPGAPIPSNLDVFGDAEVSGATTLQGGATVQNGMQVTGDLQLQGGAIRVQDGGGVDCVRLLDTGRVEINCAGELNARTGVFTDGGGNTSQITPAGVIATGTVRGNRGLLTDTATLFSAANPDRITVSGPSMFLFGNGGRLVSFEGGDVAAERNVSGLRLALRETAAPGDACGPTTGATGAGIEFVASATGGMMVCRGGQWLSLQEVATQGSVCAQEGASAIEAASNIGLICRGGRWTQTISLLSSFILIKTEQVTDMDVINKPVCPANGGAFAGVPLVLLQAGNEGSPDANFNRFAEDLGTQWRIRLVDGTLTALSGARAIAMSYCLYAP